MSRVHKELIRHISLRSGANCSHGNPQLPAKVYPVLFNFHFKWTTFSDPVTIQVVPKPSIQVDVRTACSCGWLLSQGSSSHSPIGSHLLMQIDKRLINNKCNCSKQHVKWSRKPISLTHVGLLKKQCSSPVVQILSFSRLRINFCPMAPQQPLKVGKSTSSCPCRQGWVY